MDFDLEIQKNKFNLLEEAKRIYTSPIYKIQKMASKFETSTFKLKVLFLPVAHRELNLIEMVWWVIERKVVEGNVNFILTEVESITRSEVATINPELLAKFYRNSMEEEEKYRNMNDTDGTADL